MLSERYMRHNITPINGRNEPLAFLELMLGNCLLETTFGCYPARPAPTPPDTQLGLLPCPTDGNEACTVHCNNSSCSSSNNSSGSASALNGSCTNELWTMYFNKSKTRDGSRARCVLINPNYMKHMISSRLEFRCMKNIIEYKSLMLGLHKAISLNVVTLKVVGDLETVVWKVHNTIHYLSPHLKSYQQ